MALLALRHDYRISPVLRNARQRQHRNRPRTRCNQRFGCRRKGRARGHDIIDQQDVAVPDHRLAPGWNHKRPDKVGKSTIPRPAILRARRAAADQGIRAMRHPCLPRDPFRQKRRLIVLAPQKPHPVQRYGHHHHPRFQDRLRRLDQPCRRRTGKVHPVAMLQRQNQTSGIFAVEKRRTPAFPRAGDGQAVVTANPLVPSRSLQRRPALVADQSADKGGLAPAVCAKTEIRDHRLAAADALRRVKQMQRGLHSHSLPSILSAMTSPPLLTDLPALDRQRHRAAGLSGHAAAMFLHRIAADDLHERLTEVNRRFTTPALIAGFPEIWQAKFPETPVISPTELLPIDPGTHDLVLHALALHWANDPLGQLIQCRRALKPDGLFLGVLFGGQTLQELRAALAEAESRVTGGLSPRVLPMGEIRDLGALMQRAGFALPVADSVTQTVHYADLSALMTDLRCMGEVNALAARPRSFTRRAILTEAEAIYRATFPAPDGRITATFELVFLTGWSPHASQQQPLRPGSAKARLADALAVLEQPLKGD